MIKNADGNYAEIIDLSKYTVVLRLYKNKTASSTLNPFFDKTFQYTANCGEDLQTAINEEETTPGITKGEDVKLTAEEVLCAQALENPERHRPSMHLGTNEDGSPNVVYINGAWEQVITT